jgi:hypothetical protein
MKKKDIYEVTIKIIGIVAAWKFIESIVACIIIYISFHSLTANMKFDFLGIISNSNTSIYFVVFYGVTAYLFLFQTDKIIGLLRLSSPDEVTFQLEKKTVYHIVVLLFGFFMFVYSANAITTTTYAKTDGISNPQPTQQSTTVINPTGNGANGSGSTTTTTTTTIKTDSTSTTTSVTTGTTYNVISILLLILSIPILIKSRKISGLFMPKEKEAIID